MKAVLAAAVLLGFPGAAGARIGQESSPTPGPAAQEPPPKAGAAPAAGEGLFGLPIRGYVGARYRLRRTSEESDQDLYEYLSLTLADEAKDRLTGHLFLRVSEDIDGNRRKTGFYPFDSLADTYDSSANGMLYLAHLDLHRTGPVELVRVGRQHLGETPVPIHLDGVRIDSGEIRSALSTRFGLYGGVPVHLLESSTEGDLLYGAFAEARPWKGAKVRLDALHAEDEFDGVEADNDLYGAGFVQVVDRRIRLETRLTGLDERGRDLTASLQATVPEWDVVAQVRYYELLQTQKMVLGEDVDLFTRILGEFFPYRQGRATLSKGIGDHFILEAGADVRLLKDGDDESEYNHEFAHYYLAPSLSDWPVRTLQVGATIDLWNRAGGEEGDIRTWGADLRYKPHPALEVGGGTAFSLYKYDLFTTLEKEEVRTVHLRLRWKVEGVTTLDCAVEHEKDDLDTYLTFKVGARTDF